MDMGILLITLGAALLFGLIIFFICEEKSLTNANFSDMKGLFTEELTFTECIKEFNTLRYILIFVASIFIFDLIIFQTVLTTENFGPEAMLAFIFIPSLFGSWLILLVKWTYQPIIKVISSFLFGAGAIAAAIFALGITFLTTI